MVKNYIWIIVGLNKRYDGYVYRQNVIDSMDPKKANNNLITEELMQNESATELWSGAKSGIPGSPRKTY